MKPGPIATSGCAVQPNWAKVLGEMLAEHELADRKQIDTMMARIAALEVRPVEKGEPGAVGPQGATGAPGPPGPQGPPGMEGSAGALPASLVEQINSMREMLQEPLPAAPRAALVEERPPEIRHATGSIVTRAGDLVMFYSDGTSEQLGKVTGEQGPAGPQGPPGPSGRDGIDGAKGDEGRRGRDGASVTAITKNGRKLLFALSDGQLFTVADGDEKKRA